MTESKFTVEGFGRDVDSIVRSIPVSDKPYAPANGKVPLHRFRITVEQIDEPKSVLAERLVAAWERTPYNHHLSDAFTRTAKRLGVELDHATRGSKVVKRSF